MPAQDGTAETVDKARFDGLMGAYQRVLNENRALKGSDGSPESVAQDGGTPNSQPGTEFEDGGLYEFTDGALVPFEPPTPGRYNGASRSIGTGANLDDGSPEWSKARLAAALGITPEKTTWP